MSENKKVKKRTSIKTKAIIYTSVFALLLLVTVWIFQVVLLDSFYEAAVNRTIVKTAQTVSDDIDTDDMDRFIKTLSDRTKADIKVVFADGSSVQSLSYKSILNNDGLVKYYIQQADEEGGEYFSRHIEEEKTPSDGQRPPENPGGGMPPQKKDEKKKPFETAYESESLIYCLKATTASGENAYVAVSAELSPIDSTVETIKNQLLVISILFIVIAALMGALIAKKLSSPIIAINNSAKKLADGNYSADFDGGTIKETAELSDTLNYAARELSKVDSLRRELIANVSHDLKTPLTMIRGYSEVIRDIPSENTPENVQVIIDEAVHLQRLVDDILSISKIESGMDTANLSYESITDLICDISARYSKLKGAEGYEIIFEHRENISLFFDNVKISQVIYNLINNAINYSSDDKRVTIVQTRTQTGVRIEVIDTGCGISEENIKHIFDRYYKENKAHKRAEIGTGLGLSIVKGIIELHGGTYGVVSRMGVGSSFWFELKI